MGCHKGERITRTGVTRVFRNDCNGVNNFAGVLAWVVGMFMWIFALPWVRRRSYDLFISTHQSHSVPKSNFSGTTRRVRWTRGGRIDAAGPSRRRRGGRRADAAGPVGATNSAE